MRGRGGGLSAPSTLRVWLVFLCAAVVVRKGGGDLLDTLGEWQYESQWGLANVKWVLEAWFNGDVCSTTGITCTGTDGLDVYLVLHEKGIDGPLDDLLDVGSYRIISL